MQEEAPKWAEWTFCNKLSLADWICLRLNLDPSRGLGKHLNELISRDYIDKPDIVRISAIAAIEEWTHRARLIKRAAVSSMQTAEINHIGAAGIYAQLTPKDFLQWCDRHDADISEATGVPMPERMRRWLAEVGTPPESARIAELEKELTEARLKLRMFDELQDEEGDYYAPELDLALQAYRAARTDRRDDTTNPRQKIIDWLKSACPDLDPGSNECKRILAVANWKKKH